MFKDCIVVYKGAGVDEMVCHEVYEIDDYALAVSSLTELGYHKIASDTVTSKAYGKEHLEAYSHETEGLAVVSKWLVSQMVVEQNQLLNS